MGKIECPYCLKVLKTKKGLEQHLKFSAYCQSTREYMHNPEAPVESAVNKKKATMDEQDSEDESASEDEPSAPTSKFRKLTHDIHKLDPDIFTMLDKTIQQAQKEWLGIGIRPQVEQDSMTWLNMDEVESDEEDNPFNPFTVSSSEEEDYEAEPAEDEDQEQVDKSEVPAAQKHLREWRKYLKYAFVNFAELDDKEKCAIRIMHRLVKKRATLDTYEAVMEWHLRESGKLLPHESLGKSKDYISRYVLMNKLRKRYHMSHQYAKPHSIVLPHTKTKIEVWRKNARDNVLSLLTDPRWKDEDWLYFDNDPFAPPPNDLSYIGDINTGEAYIETYKKLITKPKQILVPIPLYIDGAVTGQYDKLQVTALKMTLGILNRHARDKEYAWKSLGYVTNYTREDSRGKKIFVESGHVAAHEQYMESDDEGEDVDADDDDDVDKAQDYHAILKVLLESLHYLIKEGMVADIFYKGKLVKDCELVFFIPFVKCDGDEGDKLCGIYRSRTRGQQSLCRYCQCPNDKTDDPNAKWRYKTEALMKSLLETNNVERLQQLSQIAMENCFHGLRFGLHNNRGIHGACPWELLHAILLGIFKYIRDCFFAQMGRTSKTAEEINALAQIIGALLACQSDRDKPRTKFGKGILKGKLMAKEYSGVLLVMAALLRSQAGQDMLKSARKKSFRHDWQIRDWILLVETLLQWEAYLNLGQMDKAHVHRLKKKHRFIMFLLKKVGNRTAGMGWKVMKFHAILHLAYDIQMFGVPMNVDTGSNESHHKTTKVAAKLTQKDIRSFEKQTSNRMDDFHVLDLALEEINGRPLWDYFQGHEHQPVPKIEHTKTMGGMKMQVYKDEDDEHPSFKVVTRMNDRENVQMDTMYLHFCWLLQKKVAHLNPKLLFCTEHSRDGLIFRAHPNYRGKGVWRDWAMIKWHEGDYPGQIWGFVDLTFMGQEQVQFNGIPVGSGVWAILESADYIDEDQPMSDIFTPLMLETNEISDDGDVVRRKFYLVDCEAFKDPIVVIPDIGSIPKCKYLMMAPRSRWSEDFIQWVKMSHNNDKMEMLPDPEEGDE